MNLSRRFLIGRWLVAGLLLSGRLPAHAQPPATGQTTLPPITPQAEISIAVKTPMAYAAAGIPGQFQLTRVGSALADVTVSYQVSGKAVAGQDYKVLKGTKTFSAGKSKVSITINPLAVAGSGGTVKGVRVTLLAGDGYTLGTEVKATVKIVQ